MNVSMEKIRRRSSSRIPTLKPHIVSSENLTQLHPKIKTPDDSGYDSMSPNRLRKANSQHFEKTDQRSGKRCSFYEPDSKANIYKGVKEELAQMPFPPTRSTSAPPLKLDAREGVRKYFDGDFEKSMSSSSSESMTRKFNFSTLTNNNKMTRSMPFVNRKNSLVSKSKSTEELRSGVLTPSLPNFSILLQRTEERTSRAIEEHIATLVAEGTMEFDSKYADWIHQVFNFQLEKMHKSLERAYEEKVTALKRERELAVIECQRAYREKLLEFEETTLKFQKWYEDVVEENDRLTDERERALENFMEREEEMKQKHKMELEKAVSEIEEKFEVEKQRELKKHWEDIKVLNTKFQEQMKILEAQHAVQMKEAGTKLESLRMTNVELREKLKQEQSELDLIREHRSGKTPWEGKEEIEALRSTASALRRRVQELEEENAQLPALHAAEIQELNLKLQNSNTRITHLISESKSIIEKTKREREEKLKVLKCQQERQEREHRQNLEELRKKYGEKIDELRRAVEFITEQIRFHEAPQVEEIKESHKIPTPSNKGAPSNNSRGLKKSEFDLETHKIGSKEMAFNRVSSRESVKRDLQNQAKLSRRGEVLNLVGVQKPERERFVVEKK